MSKKTNEERINPIGGLISPMLTIMFVMLIFWAISTVLTALPIVDNTSPLYQAYDTAKTFMPVIGILIVIGIVIAVLLRVFGYF